MNLRHVAPAGNLHRAAVDLKAAVDRIARLELRIRGAIQYPRAEYVADAEQIADLVRHRRASQRDDAPAGATKLQHGLRLLRAARLDGSGFVDDEQCL